MNKQEMWNPAKIILYEIYIFPVSVLQKEKKKPSESRSVVILYELLTV